MSAQRHNSDREATGAVERMWQTYADELGIPGAESHDALAPLTAVPAAPRRGLRTVAVSAGPFVAVAAVLAVAVAAVGAYLRTTPASHEMAADTRPAPHAMAADTRLAAAPATTAETAAVPPAATDRGGRNVAPPLATSAPAARETMTRVEPQVTADAADRAAASPDTAPVSVTARVEASPAPAGPLSRITFDFGTDDVDAASKRILDRVVVAMKANPGWRVAIEGHTDALGSSEYNHALSERRAQAVKRYLEAAGVAPQRLSTAAFGASRPVAPNDARGNALNRRVELHRR